MNYALFENIFNGYDTSGGDYAAPNFPSVAIDYPQFNFQFSGYGLDAADGDVKIQGSLDNLIWTDINNVTLTQSTNFTIVEFVSTTELIVDGDSVTGLTNNPEFYIDGSTGNDGLYEASATDLQTLVTYSTLVGTFDVGEVVDFVGSGAQGVIVFDDGVGEMRVNAVTGTPAATDTLLGADSGATADVDTVTTVTSITTTGLTVEAAAGEIWEGSQVLLAIPEADTTWIYYRPVFTANSVTAGFINGFGIGKVY